MPSFPLYGSNVTLHAALPMGKTIPLDSLVEVPRLSLFLVVICESRSIFVRCLHLAIRIGNPTEIRTFVLKHADELDKDEFSLILEKC